MVTDANASSREAPAPTLTTVRPFSARACHSQSQSGSRTWTGKRRPSTRTAVHSMRRFPAMLAPGAQCSAVRKRATYGESPGLPRWKWPDGPSPRNSENHDSCSISSLRIASESS